MTIPSERTPVGTVTDASGAAVAQDLDTVLLKRVTWGAIFAGIVGALVVQVLLNMLGLGVGLGVLDANSAANNPDAGTFSMAAILWWIVSGIVASFLGGIVAGRLCGRPFRSTAGWHGLIAWAATTLIIMWAVTASVGGLIGGAFNVIGGAIGGTGSAAASMAPALAGTNDPFGQLQQEIQRSTGVNDPKVLASSVVAYLRSADSGNSAETQAARQQVVADLARTANITPDEANARLTQWEQKYQQAVQQARRGAEAARKVVAQASLYGFLALILGAIAAWFGGVVGTPNREIAVFARTPTVYGP